jgi:hypothetical protein
MRLLKGLPRRLMRPPEGLQKGHRRGDPWKGLQNHEETTEDYREDYQEDYRDLVELKGATEGLPPGATELLGRLQKRLP